jgi:hypothetical protein
MAANASIKPRTSKSLPVPELEDYGYPVAASEPSEASGWKYLSETLKELVTASQVLQARHLLCPSLTKKRKKARQRFSKVTVSVEQDPGVGQDPGSLEESMG